MAGKGLVTFGSPYRRVVSARQGRIVANVWTITLECGHVLRRRGTKHGNDANHPPKRARCTQCPEVQTAEGL